MRFQIPVAQGTAFGLDAPTTRPGLPDCGVWGVNVTTNSYCAGCEYDYHINQKDIL